MNSITVLKILPYDVAIASGAKLSQPPIKPPTVLYEVQFTYNEQQYEPTWVDYETLTAYVKAGYVPTNMLLLADVSQDMVRESYEKAMEKQAVGPERIAPSPKSEMTRLSEPSLRPVKSEQTRSELAPVNQPSDIGDKRLSEAAGMKATVHRPKTPGDSAGYMSSNIDRTTVQAANFGGSFGYEDDFAHINKQKNKQNDPSKPFELSEEAIFFGFRKHKSIEKALLSAFLGHRLRRSDISASRFLANILYPVLPGTAQQSLASIGSVAHQHAWRGRLFKPKEDSKSSAVKFETSSSGKIHLQFVNEKSYRIQSLNQMNDWWRSGGRRYRGGMRECLVSSNIFRDKADLRVLMPINGVEETINIKPWSLLKLMTGVGDCVIVNDENGNPISPAEIDFLRNQVQNAHRMHRKAMGIGKYSTNNHESMRALTKKRLFGVSTDLVESDPHSSFSISRGLRGLSYPSSDITLAKQLLIKHKFYKLGDMENWKTIGYGIEGACEDADALAQSLYDAVSEWLVEMLERVVHPICGTVTVVTPGEIRLTGDVTVQRLGDMLGMKSNLNRQEGTKAINLARRVLVRAIREAAPLVIQLSGSRNPRYEDMLNEVREYCVGSRDLYSSRARLNILRHAADNENYRSYPVKDMIAVVDVEGKRLVHGAPLTAKSIVSSAEELMYRSGETYGYWHEYLDGLNNAHPNVKLDFRANDTIIFEEIIEHICNGIERVKEMDPFRVGRMQWMLERKIRDITHDGSPAGESATQHLVEIFEANDKMQLRQGVIGLLHVLVALAEEEIWHSQSARPIINNLDAAKPNMYGMQRVQSVFGQSVPAEKAIQYLKNLMSLRIEQY